MIFPYGRTFVDGVSILPRGSRTELLPGRAPRTRSYWSPRPDVGTEPDAGRTVTIYRGLPYELPLGVELYETYYESGVPLADVPAARRESFTDHKLRSRDDAEDLVIRLEKGQVE